MFMTMDEIDLDYIRINECDIYNFHPVSGAFAIVRMGDSLLTCYNIWRKQWELPAGKIETGETPREAAIRELFEETHQKAANLTFKGLFKIYDSNKNEIRYRAVFLGELDKIVEFKQDKNDEMSKILLWDMKQDIGYVDEVDIKMFSLIEHN